MHLFVCQGMPGTMMPDVTICLLGYARNYVARCFNNLVCQGMPGTMMPDALILIPEFPPSESVVQALLDSGFYFGQQTFFYIRITRVFISCQIPIFIILQNLTHNRTIYARKSQKLTTKTHYNSTFSFSFFTYKYYYMPKVCTAWEAFLPI